MKYKFLMCIRPVMTEAEHSEQRYVTVSREKSNRSKITSPGGSTVSGRDSSRREESVGGSHKTFSQAIKAVLFEVTLRRSVRERNIVQPTPRTNSNSSRKSSCTHFDRAHDESVTRKPYRTQPEKQHQPTSPKTSTGQSNSLNPKKQSISGEEGTCVSCCSYAMYLFIVSLFATIFWGKIFGVLCTSMWLYMVPRWGDQSDRRLEKLGKLPPETEEEMVEYKKRVIMEGLPERSYRRDGGGR